MSIQLPALPIVEPFPTQYQGLQCRLLFSDVWADPALAEDLPTIANERARAAKRLTQGNQTRLLASLATMRSQLADLLMCSPSELELDRTAEGAPILPAYPTHAVSLSRSEGWSAIALLEKARIGLDIEHVHPIDWRPMLDMICSEDNAAAFLATSDPNTTDIERFYRLWTIKEALLKATGHGFRAGPKEARVPVSLLTAQSGSASANVFGTSFQIETARHEDIMLALAITAA